MTLKSAIVMERYFNEQTDEKNMILQQNALSERRYRLFRLRSDSCTCCQNKQNDGQRSSSLESKCGCFFMIFFSRTGCPKLVPLLIGIFYIITLTGMNLIFTIREINILQGSAIETTPTPTLRQCLPWKQLC